MISNVFEMRNGYTPSKSNMEFWTDGTVPWFRMEDIRTNGGILYDAIQKIDKRAIKGGRLFPKGTVAFSTSATIGVHCLLMTDCLTNQRFTALYPKPQYKDKLNTKFVYYAGFNLDKYCLEHQQISSMPSVDMKAFKEYPFPIPPLAEQERIVSILDKFDILCNDLTQGLPKELELRRKQYEYYRDKLLTFQRKGA